MDSNAVPRCARSELGNRDGSLACIGDLNHSAPGTHEFGLVIEGRHIANHHGRCARCPRCRGDRHARHGRQHAQGRSGGRRHGGIGRGVAHPKRRDVDDRLAIHDGGRRRATGKNLIGRQDQQAAGCSAKAALHCGTCADEVSHWIPPWIGIARSPALESGSARVQYTRPCRCRRAAVDRSAADKRAIGSTTIAA